MPPTFHLRSESLANAKEPVILQYCNTYNIVQRGLTADIFDKYPYSSTYMLGRYRRRLGRPTYHTEDGNTTIYNVYLWDNCPHRCRESYEHGQKCVNFVQRKLLLDAIYMLPEDVTDLAMPACAVCGCTSGMRGWIEHVHMLSKIQRDINIVFYSGDILTSPPHILFLAKDDYSQPAAAEWLPPSDNLFTLDLNVLQTGD
jgi:hypothetical protein